MRLGCVCLWPVPLPPAEPWRSLLLFSSASIVSLFAHEIITCTGFYDLFRERSDSNAVSLVAVRNLLRLKTKPCPPFSTKVCTVQTALASTPSPSFLCQLSVTLRPALVRTEFLKAHFGPAQFGLVLGSCISVQLNMFNLYFCRDQPVAVIRFSSSPELLVLGLVRSLCAQQS